MDKIKKTTKSVTEKLQIKPTAAFPVTEWLVKIIVEEYEKIKDETNGN